MNPRSDQRARSRHFFLRFLAVTVSLFSVASAMATPTVFELYTEINVGATQGDPGLGAVFGSELFFEGDPTGAFDGEPYRFDGTTVTQITNANPPGGGADSNLTSQFVFANRLYAVMESNVGRELFQYNTGTQQYEIHTDLNGAGDGFPIPATDVNGDVVIFGGHLLMTANFTGSDRRIYRLRSDTNVLELLPGPTRIDPSNFAIFGGELFYEADDGSGNDEPFRFNGATEFQITNTSAPGGGADSNLTAQFVFAGRLYAVMESNVGRELYQYNTGTQAYDVHTNLNGAGDGFPIPASDVNGDAIVYGSHFLMTANIAASDRRIYRLRSDTNVLELLPGPTRIDPSNFATLGGELFYEADDGSGNDEPFRFDGTTEFQITNASPPGGGADSNLTAQFVFLGDMYAVMESANGRELFKYNTGNGMYEVLINLNGGGDGFPIPIRDVNGAAIIYQSAMMFNAEDSGIGRELFRLRMAAAPPSLSINDVTANETNSGSVNFTFTVTRSNNTSAVSVDFTTANGSAMAGSDFTANSGTLNFANGGSLTQSVVVSVSGDTTVELNETFNVNLTNPGGGATISDGMGLGTITNDDSATVSINDLSQAEGNGGATAYMFSVSLSAPVDVGVSANYGTADSSATNASGDYASGSGMVSFPANSTASQSITVNANGDSLVELDETFLVNLSGLTAGGRSVSFSDTQGIATITNDDSATVSIADVSQMEGNGGTTTYGFMLSLSNPVDAAVSVDADTSNSSAMAGSDYVANTGNSVTFMPMTMAQTFNVTVNGDTTVELDETFLVDLSGLMNSGRAVSLGDAQGQGTIVNDDAATLSINDVTQAEGDAGTTSFDFTVTLDNDVDTGLTVDFASADGSATLADNDYMSNNGTLNFAGNAGEMQSLSVQVNGDLTVESDEVFVVDLSNLMANGRNVSLSDAQGDGTITNDDAASLSIDDVSVTELDSGSGMMTFTVTLDAAVDGGVMVDFDTADDSAVAPGDYANDSGTLTFTGSTAGETQTVSVEIAGETLVELDETLFVNLSNVSNASVTLGDAQGQGTIVNNDSATVSIDDVTMLEGDAGTTAFTFSATLSGDVDVGVDVDFDTADDTATVADSDYQANSGTISFAGTMGEVQSITVQVNGDAVLEPDETFLVDLSSLVAMGRDVTIADAQGVGTIVNDEPDLSATKTATFEDPLGFGSIITYMIVITNDGATAMAVQFDDVPDPDVTIVPGSVATTQGTVLTGNAGGDTTISVDIGDVAGGGAQVAISYDVEVSPNAVSGTVIENQGLLSGTNFPDLLTDDPAVAGGADPTVLVTAVMLVIPTLGTWGLIGLMLILGVIGARRARLSR